MQYSKYDLHCHSFESDGDMSPADVVDRAFANNVEYLSLTDHDTISGQKEAMLRAKEIGMNIVSGIELSCVWKGYGVHILAYNFSLVDGLMYDVQLKQSETRINRAAMISKRLVSKGLPDFLEAAQSLTKSGVPGRPHFAEAMVNSGVVNSFNEAFKKYLGTGKAGDVKGGWPELAEVLNWIRAANGTAVIAHPRKYKMSLTRLRALIADFKEYGGEGLEVVVSGQKQGEIGLMTDLCNRFKLKGSVGSDFHTTRFPWADLGKIPPLPQSVDPVWSDWT